MGVDFFVCAACEDTVCDCGPYTSCCGCDGRFCVGCHPGPGLSEDDVGRDGKIACDPEEARRKLEACPLCSLREVNTHALLYFLLRKLGWDREEAEGEFRKSRRAAGEGGV
jgi:hypothetical protein